MANPLLLCCWYVSPPAWYGGVHMGDWLDGWCEWCWGLGMGMGGGVGCVPVSIFRLVATFFFCFLTGRDNLRKLRQLTRFYMTK